MEHIKMTKYIEVVNNSNIVSVDDTQPRLSLMRSIPLNTIGYDNEGNYRWSSEYSWGNEQYRTINWKRFPIQLVNNEKMFSIRALQDNPHIGFSRLASGNTLSYLYAYENTYNQKNYSNYVIDFYGYDNSEANGVGLQIYNESGNPIFNSDKYYFDVKGQYNVQQQDMWRGRFYTDSKFPRNIDIGGYSRSNTAVVINNGSFGFCGYFYGDDLPPYDIIYTVVLGGTIHLEPRIAFWTNSWSPLVNPTNHIAYPNYSRVSSGLFLDTTNIS